MTYPYFWLVVITQHGVDEPLRTRFYFDRRSAEDSVPGQFKKPVSLFRRSDSRTVFVVGDYTATVMQAV